MVTKKFIERIAQAYCDRYHGEGDNCMSLARESFRELRAIVKAAVPGRQSTRNVADMLDRATAALCRCIRSSK